MALRSQPTGATEIIGFGDKKGSASIRFDVPLPASQAGRRLVLLSGLNAADFTPAATQAGADLRQDFSHRAEGGGVFSFDPTRAASYFRSQLARWGAPPAELAAIDQAITALRESGTRLDQRTLPDVHAALTSLPYDAIRARSTVREVTSELSRPMRPMVPTPYSPTSEPPMALEVATSQQAGVSTGTLPPLVPELIDYLAALSDNNFCTPQRQTSGSVTCFPIDPAPAPTPALFLVEVYAITSFPGDYGLGRTVRTFTLFPGESSEISVRTWRTTSQQRANSSSIFDSFSSEASDRFTSQLDWQLSTSSRDENSERFKWNAGGSFGIDFGLVSLGGGGGVDSETQHHTIRDEFSGFTSRTLNEHANQSNAAREMSVSSTSEQVEETGEEVTTVRTIRNVNMRRTLNFVFRELNQTFETYLHLVDLRVAFANGRADSWQEVSLSELRPFISRLVVPQRVNATIQRVLRTAGTVFDLNGAPVNVLETVGLNRTGLTRTISNAAPGPRGNYPLPRDDFVYRFHRGPLGNQRGTKVDGVIINKDSVVLRTDSLIAEALLGQADALDQYAMAKQAADADMAVLANDRESLAQSTLAAIANPEQRARSFRPVYTPEHDQIRVSLDEHHTP
jgi:hypothetical protein